MTTNCHVMNSAALLRDVVREYVRSQRRSADCGDTASTVECHLLTELVRAGQCTQQELAGRLMLDKGWISRGVDRLAAAGQVTRTPDPADKRRVRLRLTPAGRRRAGALDARLDTHAASLLGDLTADEEDQLAGLLAKVLANLRASLVYRRAQAADRPAIDTLLRGARLPVEDVADHFGHFTVGTGPTGIVAVGGFEQHGADALLRSFVVAEGARGRALGGELLRHVLHDARRAGIRTAYLLTQTAEHFFARHGFEPVARDDAPPAIRATRQFAGLCPASARLMMLSLSEPAASRC